MANDWLEAPCIQSLSSDGRTNLPQVRWASNIGQGFAEPNAEPQQPWTAGTTSQQANLQHRFIIITA